MIYNTTNTKKHTTWKIRLKNNYNFNVIKLHLKFNQCTNSMTHKLQIRFECSQFDFFQLDLCISKGMIKKIKKNKESKIIVDVWKNKYFLKSEYKIFNK